MKKYLYLVLLFLTGFTAFANNGVLAGTKKLNVIQTKWFDIIYPEECKQSANIISQNADRMYLEICKEYNTQAWQRIPVVLTPSVESFNGYYTNSPYVRIVLYDTCVVEDIAVFTSTILNTFKHELTHAVTFGLKSPILKSLASVFGDAYTDLSWWMTSRAMAEGATLTEESSAGEGRLNDDFAKHYVMQAKIQDEFPDYYDIQGAVDLYPIGAFYIYGGTFNSWLCNKYGKEKYAQLWYISINLLAIDINSAFERVYTKSVRTLWNEFISEIPIPQNVQANPITAGLVKDFFKPNTNEFSVQNESGSIYVSLTSCSDGIAYIDSSCDSVFYASKNELKKEEIHPEKLFTLQNVYKIKFSGDNKFLVVSYYKNKSTTKKALKLYDLENKKFINCSDTGFDNPVLLKDNNEYYLVSQKFVSQNYYLEVSKIIFNQNKTRIEKIEPVNKYNFNYGVYALDITFMQNGSICFIKRENNLSSLCFANLDFSQIAEVKVPATGVRHIFSYNDDIYFSWTKNGSLSRIGKYDLDNQRFTLQKDDYSGGIYNPVICDKNIYYIGKFWRNTKIVKICKDFNVEYTFEDPVELKNYVQKESQNLFTQNEFNYVNYNPFRYYKEGLFLPVSLISLSNHELTDSTYELPFGITYETSNPWGGNQIILSSGYGFKTQSFATQLSYNSISDTNLFNYGIKETVEFDKDGFKKIDSALNMSSIIDVLNYSKIFAQEYLDVDYGRNNFYIEDLFKVGFSCVHYTGPSRYQKSGIDFSAVYNYKFFTKSMDFKTPEYNVQDIGFISNIYIPRIIPITTKQQFVYNLPTKISFNLFADNYDFSDLDLLFFTIPATSLTNISNTSLFGIQSETILFGYEIQHAIPYVLWLVANEIRVSLVYRGGFEGNSEIFEENFKIANLEKYILKIQKDDLQYSDSITLRFAMGLTTNFGSPSKVGFSLEGGIADLRTKIRPIWGVSFNVHY